MTSPPLIPTRLTDPLGRYYTKQNASEAVVAHLGSSEPARIIDLGCGDGALSSAAWNRWTSAELTTVDIDRSPTLLNQLSPLALHSHFTCDALASDLPDIIDSKRLRPDLAVCNPPFIKRNWHEAFSEILDDARLSGIYKKAEDAITEILFLAQNLRVLKNNGKVGIIVPDSIINGKRHSDFRQSLLANHTIESVTKLPRTAFQKTDAQAFILTIIKGRPTDKPIKLRQINDDGELAETIYAAPDKNGLRLDYGYYRLPKPKHNQPLLKDLGAHVFRGRLTSSQRKDFPCIHTTDFPSGNDRYKFDIPERFWPESKGDPHLARAGDILLSRVGRNLEEKICLVNSGVSAVTDCVYVIRAPLTHRERILDSLISGVAHLWLKETAHGVSARQLPKADLLSIPI